MFHLILQHLDKRRTQTVSTVLSVLLTVAVVFALILVWSGVSKGIQTSQERMGADIVAVPEEVREMMSDSELLFTGAPVASYMDEDVIKKIQNMNGVEKVTAQFYGQTLNAACCSTGREQRIIGFDPETDWIIRPWMDRELNRSLDEDEVIIGSDVGGFEDGKGTVLGEKFRLAGVLDPTGTGLDNSILADMETVRRLSKETEGYEHYWEKYGDPGGLVSAVMIKTSEDSKTGAANVIEMQDGLAAVSSADVLGDIQGRMSMIFRIMVGAGILFVIAMIVTLFGRFWTMAWDRKAELGLYRALGASEKDLKKLILGEAVTITLAGSLAGLLIGGGIYMLLVRLLMDGEVFPYAAPSAGLVFLTALGMVVFAGLIGCLSAIRPLGQIRKIDPSLAMEKSDID